MGEEIDYDKLGASVAHHLSEGGIHCVSFDPETRKTVHMVHESRVETGATQGDIVMAMNVGRSLNQSTITNVTKAMKFLLVAIVIMVAILVMKTFGLLDWVRLTGK